MKRLLDRMGVGRCALQPPGHPRVHRFAARSIVVVFGVEAHRSDMIVGAEHRVEAAHRRKLDFHRLARPVAGRRHHQKRPRRNCRSDLDVVRVDAQAGQVFTQTSALHMERDHVDRRCRCDAVVHGRQEEGLRSAARFAGHPDAIAPNIRERFEEVEPTDAVPQLQPAQAQSP